MLVTTRGIVLNKINYGESSIIAKIYTEKFGLQSYIFKGIKRNKSKNKRSLLEHLTIVEITAYYNDKSSIKVAKEIKLELQYKSIHSDIFKSAIAVFINEILYNTLKEEEKNNELFDFLINSLLILDMSQDKFINFHLIFLLKYVKYLGFYPLNNFSEKNMYFNLTDGIFQQSTTSEGYYLNKQYSCIFSKLIDIRFDEMGNIELNTDERRFILEQIIKYYRLHINNLGNVNSFEVLRYVLS